MRHYKASLPFILITVFVDVLGIGLMLPVLPALSVIATAGGRSCCYPFSG